MAVSRWYSAKRAAQLADLSPGMLDYLCRERIVMPAGTPQRVRGKRRRYSFGDVVILRSIARLLEQGVEVKRLKVSLRRLAEQFQRLTDEPYVTRYLVTDGKDIYFHNSSDVWERPTDGQLAFAFLLDVHLLQDDVKNERRTPPEQKRRRARGLAPTKLRTRHKAI